MAIKLTNLNTGFNWVILVYFGYWADLWTDEQNSKSVFSVPHPFLNKWYCKPNRASSRYWLPFTNKNKYSLYSVFLFYFQRRFDPCGIPFYPTFFNMFSLLWIILGLIRNVGNITLIREVGKGNKIEWTKLTNLLKCQIYLSLLLLKYRHLILYCSPRYNNVIGYLVR